MDTFFSKGWDGAPFSLFEAAHLVHSFNHRSSKFMVVKVQGCA